MRDNRRSAFTLIEILIVVVIMAVLAATIIPQFTDSTEDAKLSTAEFNLNTLRAQIELFKAQHGGTAPDPLSELTTTTTYDGKTYNPYLNAVPENTITGSTAAKASAGSPIVIGDITAGDGAGWVYDSDTGEVRLDHVDHWQK